MENLYEPYEVLVSEDGEIVVLVEPDDKISQLLEKDTQPELVVDVDYDEEEEELYLAVSVIFDETEIFFGLPYGEAWDELIENEAFAVAVISREDFEAGKVEDVPVVEIGLDEITIGFIEGASRTAQVLIGETAEEEE